MGGRGSEEQGGVVILSAGAGEEEHADVLLGGGAGKGRGGGSGEGGFFAVDGACGFRPGEAARGDAVEGALVAEARGGGAGEGEAFLGLEFDGAGFDGGDEGKAPAGEKIDVVALGDRGGRSGDRAVGIARGQKRE